MARTAIGREGLEVLGEEPLIRPAAPRVAGVPARCDGPASAGRSEGGEETCLLLESLAESVCDGLVALDFRGAVAHVSDSLLEGRAGGPLVEAARGLRSGGIPRGVLRRLRREAAFTQPGRAHRFDLIWERPESGIRNYRVVAVAGAEVSTVSASEPGRLTLFAFQDRTREVALQEELGQARQMAALGQMAATVAHELRNPLGAIQGFATLLKRDLEGQSGPRRQVDRILQGVENADRIVADLLEYCRPLRLSAGPLALSRLLEESLTELKAAPRWRSGLKIDLRLDADLAPCRGDRRLLLLVLANLYNNALDAMGEEGTLSILARAAGPTTRSDRLRVIVRDTGCGLAAEEVARVFAPFYTTKPGGTGLGLALVRKIVEAHGGHVHVVSAPLRGTSVVVDLPTDDSSGEGDPAREADAAERGAETAYLSRMARARLAVEAA